MTPVELADFLRIDPEKLYDMRARGTGPAFVKVGREVRYRWHDVRDWLDEHVHLTTAEARRGA